MSSAQSIKPIEEMTLEEKIAELDRDVPEADTGSETSHRATGAQASQDSNAQTPHIAKRKQQITTTPLIADDTTAIVDEPDHHSDDPVQAMQQLLLKHEDTRINRVEDPDLLRVLDELRTLAHSNIADLFELKTVLDYVGLDGNDEEVYRGTERLQVKDITKLPRELSACIQSVKVTSTKNGDAVEIKMYDKMVSLDKLMRFHGAYVKDNEQVQSANSGIMDLLITSIGSHGLPVIENNNS